MSTITAIIPVYNAVRYLPEAIASVQQQTRSPIEIIVIDDRSTDGSGEVAARCGAHVLTMPVNSGPSAARNAGIQQATGTYVAMLDADDHWKPNHCEVGAGLLDAHPSAAVASSRVRYFGMNSGVTDGVVAENEPVHVFIRMLGYNLVPQVSAVARRDVVLGLGGYDESLRYAEDYDLWFRIARTHPLVFSHAVTASYRVHPHQASQNSVKLFTGAWGVRRRHFEWLAQQGDSEAIEAGASELRQAVKNELRWAWDASNRSAIEAIVAAAAWVPGAEQEVGRWSGRLGVTWPLWRIASSLRSRVRRRVRG